MSRACTLAERALSSSPGYGLRLIVDTWTDLVALKNVPLAPDKAYQRELSIAALLVRMSRVLLQVRRSPRVISLNGAAGSGRVTANAPLA